MGLILKMHFLGEFYGVAFAWNSGRKNLSVANNDYLLQTFSPTLKKIHDRKDLKISFSWKTQIIYIKFALTWFKAGFTDAELP